MVVVLIGAACGGARRPQASPASTTASAPTTVTTAAPAASPAAPTTSTAAPGWVLGARPLPLGPDGKPLPQETPPELRERRLTAPDALPPPSDGLFHSSIRPVDDAIAARIGTAWQPGCPVPLSGLRYLNVAFKGFDGRAHTGELIVATSEAEDIVGVFRTLFEAGFPIEEMRLPTGADLDAAPTGDGNDTAGFVCRATRGSTSFSAHAHGLAVDVNPFQNPYVKGDVVLPELARAYTDRSRDLPGMIRRGDVVTKAFASIGWTWGGSFTSLEDTMHFSANGR